MKLLTHRTTRRRRGVTTMSLAATLAALALLGATPALAANSAMAWGDNEEGQLGNGTTVSTDFPVAVSGLSGVSGIAAGAEHSLAIVENSKVMAWGNNEDGQLGNGTETSSDVPVLVSGMGGSVKSIAAGGQHSLALATEGLTRHVFGWGNDAEGQLGDGETEGTQLSARLIAGLGQRAVLAIAAGGEHSLALVKDGTIIREGVMSFGANGRGQLGNGTDEEQDTPVYVSGLSSGVTAIAAGGEHSLALLSNGTVMAWGDNAIGQLGHGTTTSSDVPVAVSGLSGVTAIAAGHEHSLALLSNGTVMAWGANGWGQLGDGTTNFRDAPVAVKGLSGVTAIAAGGAHSLALLSNGTVMAWGANQDGQLGNGEEEAEYSDVPLQVSGLSGVVGIAAGEHDSLAFGAPTAVPAVTGLSAHGGSPNGATEVTITGTNLNLATAVHFGSASATSFVVNSPSSITAFSPAGTGVVEVTVTNAVGTSAPSSADRFSYLPTVTGVSPDRGLPAGGNEVTITGTSFAGVSAVNFGFTSVLKFTVNSESSITALVPPGLGSVNVTVTATGGTSTTNPADQYTYGTP